MSVCVCVCARVCVNVCVSVRDRGVAVGRAQGQVAGSSSDAWAPDDWSVPTVGARSGPSVAVAQLPEVVAH